MPDVAEMAADPRARREGIVKARALPAGHLKELCEAEKGEAEKATAGLRTKWQRWWDLWQSEVSFRDKEEWQSQVWVPKPFTAVEQAAALIKRSLLDSPEFYGVSGTDDQDKRLAAHVWKPLLKVLLDQARFIPKYAAACKVGFIMGVAGYMKYRWQVTETPVLAGVSVDPETGAMLPEFRHKSRSMLAIDYVLPWHIRRDPDTVPLENFSGTYLWHSEFKDKAALRSMERHWDRDALARLLASNRSASPDTQGGGMQESERQEAERKQYGHERHKFRKSYLVDEGWLDILDQNGDVVLPNGFMVHSHGEILCLPKESPVWATDLTTGRRKWPFIAAATIEHPSRFEGRGILEQDEDLSLMYSNTLNLFADGMNWKVNPGTEVYQAGLIDIDDTSDYPGKLWLKTVKEQVLHAAERGEVKSTEVMAFLNFLDQQRENSNFVNNFVQGAQGWRKDITMGETQIRTAQSMGVFEGMSRNLELGGRDGVELAYNLAAQYMGGNDFVDPSIASVLGPRSAMLLSTMPLAERIKELQGNLSFTFSSISQALQKADLLTKVMQFATLAGSAGYAGRTNPSQLLRVISRLLGLDDQIDVYDAPAMVAGPGMGMGPGVIPDASATMNAIGAGSEPQPALGG